MASCSYSNQIVVGCNTHPDTCTPNPAVKLLYNKNPATDHWYFVQPLCLPDLNGVQTDCRPSHYHSASEYSAEGYPSWTWITIDLPDTVYSRYCQQRPAMGEYKHIMAGCCKSVTLTCETAGSEEQL